MKAFALGFLVLLCTLLLGLTVGIGVFFGLAAAGVSEDFAGSLGLGVWWLTAIVLFAYANIWLDPFGRLRGAQEARSSRPTPA